MEFKNLGIVGFFGILCPGVLLFINICFLLYNLEPSLAVSMLKSMPRTEVSWVALFLVVVVCYLLGFILRLTSPDVLDKSIKKWAFRHGPCRGRRKELLKKFREEGIYAGPDKDLVFETFLIDRYLPALKEEAAKKELEKKLKKYIYRIDNYPYYLSNKFLALLNDAPHLKLMMNGKDRHNNVFYNFLKLWLSKANPGLYATVEKREAEIRFISGAYWALAVGAAVSLVSLILIVLRPCLPCIGEGHAGLNCSACEATGLIVKSAVPLFYGLGSIYLMGIIREGFKWQRRREASVLLNSVLLARSSNNDPFAP